MRLGVLIDRLRGGAGGAEAHTVDLLARAVATGEEVVLATLAPAADPALPPGVEHLEVAAPRRRPARDRVLATRGVAALRDAGCDVVLAFRHAPGCDVYLPHGGLVTDAIAARDRARGGAGLLRRLARVLSPKVRYFLEAEAALLGRREGPRVIAVARQLAARIRAAWPAAAERVVAVAHGVDAGRFAPATHAAAGAARRRAWGLEGAYVALLAAHDPVLKGARTAIAALAEPAVARLAPPCHLVVAGGGLPRRLRRLARRLGVASRVHEIGMQDDLRPVLAAADVLVHPTFHDPCSLVCLEALAMAVPVITTPENGAREIMGMRGGIVLERSGLPDALAVALRVLADRELREATAQDARYLAETHRAVHALDRVLEHCREAAGARPVASGA